MGTMFSFSRNIKKVAYIHRERERECVLGKYFKLFTIYKITCIFIGSSSLTTREQIFVGLVHDNQCLK